MLDEKGFTTGRITYMLIFYIIKLSDKREEFKMIVTKIKVNQDNYYIGLDEIGITFISDPNGTISEISSWFDDVIYQEFDRRIPMIEEQLSNYLCGRTTIIELPVHLIGTPFQISVWEELEKIPYGKTITYLEVATRLGDPKKVRAVANAIGRNPILYRIPCHRVIGSDGSLKGFSAGLDLKKKLLNMEAKQSIY